MDMINRQPKNFSLLSITIAGTLLVNSSLAMARDYFDPGLLSLNEGQLATTDLSVFETSGKIPPGVYTMTLFVIQLDRGEHSLVFKEDG